VSQKSILDFLSCITRESIVGFS